MVDDSAVIFCFNIINGKKIQPRFGDAALELQLRWVEARNPTS